MTTNDEEVAGIKVGDVVHVRMRVTDVGLLAIECVEESSGDKFFPFRTSIVHVEPRALQVGDWVTWGGASYRFEIRAIDGEHALLRNTCEYYGSSGYVARPLVDLTRVED